MLSLPHWLTVSLLVVLAGLGWLLWSTLLGWAGRKTSKVWPLLVVGVGSFFVLGSGLVWLAPQWLELNFAIVLAYAMLAFSTFMLLVILYISIKSTEISELLIFVGMSLLWGTVIAVLFLLPYFAQVLISHIGVQNPLLQILVYLAYPIIGGLCFYLIFGLRHKPMPMLLAFGFALGLVATQYGLDPLLGNLVVNWRHWDQSSLEATSLTIRVLLGATLCTVLYFTDFFGAEPRKNH